VRLTVPRQTGHTPSAVLSLFGLDECCAIRAASAGILVCVSGVLTLLSRAFDFPPIIQVRAIWNIIFGVLILFLQLGWEKFITRRFGFLHHWFLRGIFYLFVGTNVMECERADGSCVFSIAVGLTCMFVGVIELLFGAKCHGKEDADLEGGGGAGGGANAGRAQVNSGPEGPSLTVNVTPAQAMQGASFAAKAAASQPSGGGANDNPFFGNAHRT